MKNVCLITLSLNGVSDHKNRSSSKVFFQRESKFHLDYVKKFIFWKSFQANISKCCWHLSSPWGAAKSSERYLLIWKRQSKFSWLIIIMSLNNLQLISGMKKYSWVLDFDFTLEDDFSSTDSKENPVTCNWVWINE